MSTWQELKDNPRLKKIHDDRIAIVKAIREFFWSEGFVEAETPLALVLPGQEPYLNPVELKIQHPSGKTFDLKLRTSPEFALKKLLAAGYSKIFELGKCFRNNEDFGGTHSPEFTMIEWYRAPGSLEDIMTDTENLFRFVLKRLGKEKLEIRNSKLENGEFPISNFSAKADPDSPSGQFPISDPWDRASLKDLFKKYLDVNLDEHLEIEPLKKLATARGHSFGDADEYEDIFFKIFLNEIETNLGIEKPIFVYDYPARMCSLSKLSKDPRYAERFELYIGGLEVANAFGELTDPVEQKINLEKDQALRKKLSKPTWPIDEGFISALSELNKMIENPKSEIRNPKSGVGGIALGVDRMVVLCTGARDIGEVIFGNISDQLEFLNPNF